MTLEARESLYQITLATADGQAHQLTCDRDQDILSAAAQAGLTLPSMCKKGTCGACRAEVVAGDYVHDSHSPDVLGPAERAKRAVLLCRTRPMGELHIALPFDSSRILAGAPAVRAATIVTLEEVAAGMVRLVLQLEPDADGGLGVQFEPGQFVQLEIPGEAPRRAYSLANVANWEGIVELFIKRRPGGWFSSYLESRAEVGARLAVHGPQGAFGLRETGLRPRYFVAGGSGLSPLLSMLRRMAEWQEPHEARLYFGVNSPAEVFAVAELDAVRAQLPQFRYELRVWRPDADWKGEIGTPLDGLRRDLEASSVRPEVYVCGPPALIDATVEVAVEFGLDRSQVFAERFVAS